MMMRTSIGRNSGFTLTGFSMMGFTAGAVVAAVLSSCAAGAQTAPSTMPAPAASSAPATPAKLTLDSPIAALRADPAAKAVVDRELPALATNPGYEQFKVLSLKQLAPYSQGAITPEILTRIGQALQAPAQPAN